MAEHDIARGNIAVHDVALGAGVADKVLFADDVENVEILSDGTAAIYVCVSGDDAVVSGGECFKIPAGAVSSITVPVAGRKVSLVSAGTPVYSVTAV